MILCLIRMFFMKSAHAVQRWERLSVCISKFISNGIHVEFICEVQLDNAMSKIDWGLKLVQHVVVIMSRNMKIAWNSINLQSSINATSFLIIKCFSCHVNSCPIIMLFVIPSSNFISKSIISYLLKSFIDINYVCSHEILLIQGQNMTRSWREMNVDVNMHFLVSCV